MCLFGIGRGHAADVLMWSKLRVGSGCGEEDRVCSEAIGRGRARVAIALVWCRVSCVVVLDCRSVSVRGIAKRIQALGIYVSLISMCEAVNLKGSW